MISDEYKELNKQFHEQSKNYGSHGGRWSGEVLSLANAMGTKDVLDYGCGKATLSQNLPFTIQNYDPCVEKYAKEPNPADLVICNDVMEHVEPEYTDAVLDHIKSLTKRTAYIVVSCSLANKHLPDGRNAHINVRPYQWWMNKLMDRFYVVKTVLQMMKREFPDYPKSEGYGFELAVIAITDDEVKRTERENED